MCQDVVTTEWVAGGVAEVGWGIIANHGGGYQYRLCRWGSSYLISSLIYNVIYDNQLCRKPETGMADLTEECFQQMPLRCTDLILMRIIILQSLLISK